MSADTESERQPRPADRTRRAVMLAIGLAAVGRLPRDPRFQRDVILVAILMAAAIGAARNGGTASRARLAARDARQQARSVRTAAKASVNGRKKPR